MIHLCAWLSASKLQFIVLRLVIVLSHINVCYLEFILKNSWCRVHNYDDPCLARDGIPPLLLSCCRNQEVIRCSGFLAYVLACLIIL